MDFSDWEPAYEAVLEDFGYDRGDDEAVRDVLDSLVEEADGSPRSVSDLDCSGTVAVCGAAPSLSAEIEGARNADTVVAASAAADVLQAVGVEVDCLVTDLDSSPVTARQLSESGTTVAVHAHGDNEAAVRKQVPELDVGSVLPTTQAEPVGHVENPGGFTDGDRAAFLADAAGADRLTFPGWDLDDPTVGEIKARKLEWAERMLYWLEERRDERFEVLNGRRIGIELPWL
ncbi:MAG: DUF115 domain-containing protein [Natronomonas sp.]